MDRITTLDGLALELTRHLRAELDRLETLRAESVTVEATVHKPGVPPFRLSLSIAFLEPEETEGEG